MLKSSRNACLIAAFAAALLAPGVGSAHDENEPPLSGTQIPELSAADRARLKGTIDIHVHLDPDSFGPNSSQAARQMDIVEMARRAKAGGMRGFVIKQHYDQTAQLAFLSRKAVPGVEAFGMLVLNHPVGGMNPAAVNHFTEIKGGFGRIVSMPTWDSVNNISESRDPKRKAVEVSRNGELLPETKAVIELIAKAKLRDSGASLTLATGHITAEEGVLVVREGKRAGVKQMIVTHAMGHPVHMTMAQMKEVASLGAYIEFVANFTQGERKTFTAKQYADAIRELGPDHVILSSDGGQVQRPAPDETLALVAKDLSAEGISDADLRKMLVDNPAAALGVAR